MKTDRFVKVMLVIIAGLLFLNCVKDVSFTNSNSPANAPTTSRNGSTQSPNPTKTSFIETSVEAASVPAFIQVGKTYSCMGEGPLNSIEGEKIVQIDANSGWIEKESNSGRRWINVARLFSCDSSSQSK